MFVITPFTCSIRSFPAQPELSPESLHETAVLVEQSPFRTKYIRGPLQKREKKPEYSLFRCYLETTRNGMHTLQFMPSATHVLMQTHAPGMEARESN